MDWPPPWPGFVLGAGVVLSLLLFFTIRAWEERDLDRKTAEMASEQVERLRVTMLRSMEVLHSIASLHAGTGEFTRSQFREFVRRALERQPELQAVSWNPYVPAGRRAALEAAAVAEGAAGFQIRERGEDGALVPAAVRPAYVPVYYIEPEERNAAALGLDLNSDPLRGGAVAMARDTGDVTATAPLHLAQAAEGQAGLLVLLPVYAGPRPTTVEERRARLRGLAVAVFRVADWVGGAFGELRARGIEARLFDDTADGRPLYGADAGGGWTARTPLEVAGRKWSVAFAPTPEMRARQSHWQSLLALLAGVTFSALTAGNLYGSWRRNAEIAAANGALQAEVSVRQEAEAAAAAANAAKSDFLASMSHEIRTPLNAILGYAQLLQRDRALPPEQRDAIGGISAGAHHLLGLINEILDLSKIEAGRMELNPVDFDLGLLSRDLAATFRPLCDQKRIGFRIEAEVGEPPRVRGDEGKLRQVLINLLGNAVKFTQHGEVSLRCTRAGPDVWRFEVIDTGLGIPEAEQEHIFRPFHQGDGGRHLGGTGLGLAIAQRQVALLGGALEVQSERGIGSRFFFSIPLGPSRGAAGAPERPVSRLTPGTTLAALVVDDRPENQAVLAGMLGAVGCEVSRAADGETAISEARLHHPAIVFLDLLMPGLSGAETARRILADPACGSPKIVAHTASPLARHRDEALAAGCVDFIPKPLACEKVYDCLRRYAGAQFEYGPAPRDDEALPPLERGRTTLPQELYSRLSVAAELHSTTALKAALQDLRRLGPGAEALAAHLRRLMRSYDMDGILRLLAQAAEPQPSSISVPAHDTAAAR